MATATNPSMPALDRRPEARTLSIEDLLAELRRGRIRIPDFQRGFKWKRKDAQDLLDSIDRGYPIGTLLFWETAAALGRKRPAGAGAACRRRWRRR